MNIHMYTLYTMGVAVHVLSTMGVTVYALPDHGSDNSCTVRPWE